MTNDSFGIYEKEALMRMRIYFQRYLNSRLSYPVSHQLGKWIDHDFR